MSLQVSKIHTTARENADSEKKEVVATPDFGLDLDDFLNQRSELFGYYRMKEYSVEPF